MGMIGLIAATALSLCSASFGEADQTEPKAKPPAPQTSKTASSQTQKTTKSAHSKPHTASTSTTSHKGKKSKKASRRGQQKIDFERAHQIQQALIRQHYLSGEPTGTWDPATEEALRRFQADSGWQNKTVPDSRALIKLGLGPNHDHLLNPESAMTSAPDAPRTTGTPATPAAPADPAGPPTQPQR
jgi:peptidoglycan hydrolase-like protein with peptidoglycan-binding domain